MNEIIERAARAICTTFGYDPDKDDEVGLCEPGDVNWNMFEDHARAVLQAIREPNEAIRQAMRENVPVDGYEWEFSEREELSNGMVVDPIRDCWQAMIDAALSDD